ACKRIALALERIEHQAEIAVGVGGARIDLERLGDQPEGLAGATTLQLEHAAQMQGVELPGMRLEHAAVDLLRLVQAPLLMRGERLLDRGAQVLGRKFCSLGHGGERLWPMAAHVEVALPSTRSAEMTTKACANGPSSVMVRSMRASYPAGVI